MTLALARLRKRAAELEHKKQFDRALEVYVQILDQGGKDLDDEDMPLFNRVGDMLLRKGSVTDALGYYERAVDVYAERGYLNNAIALCSKILRQSPGRAAVYYKLARISAKKGFRSDARKNFLEYADRMQKTGQSEEAFRALKEFASLYPEQDDVRLILAELLSKENRKGEALEQLQSLYEKLQSEGRAAEARATVDRMRAIDPSVTPAEGTSQPAAATSDLVFLDLSETESPAIVRRTDDIPPPVSARAPIPSPVPALTGLDITFLPDDEHTASPDEFMTAEEEGDEANLEPPVATQQTKKDRQLDLGPEAADAAIEAPVPTPPSLAGVQPVEPTDHAMGTPAPLERIEQEIEDLSPVTPTPTAAGTPRSVTPMSSSEFAGIELDEVPSHHGERNHDLALPLQIEQSRDDLESVSPSALESAAAAEDARAAAEEAADIAADIASRTAAQQPLPPEWSAPPQPPTPDEIAARQPETGDSLGDEPLIPARTRESATGPSADFLSQPPNFGASGTSGAEHAFPPLAGLDDSGTRPPSPADAPENATPVASVPTPRRTVSIGSAESHLRSRLELDPENWDLHRQLGEALLEAGDRDGGLYEFELAMTGFELGGDLDRAQELVDEILGVVPASVAHHQKRVEFAVKSRDRMRLAHSYLELADALFRTGSAGKAVAVYGRVLELDPDNERAEFALVTLSPERLTRLRGGPVRADRWTDELDVVGRGESSAPPAEATEPRVPDEEEPVEGPVQADEVPDGEVEPQASPSPALSSPRVRFSSIEFPVPDWGEGTPERMASPVEHREGREEPDSIDSMTPAPVVEANETVDAATRQASSPSAARTPTPPSRLGTPATPLMPQTSSSPTPIPWPVPAPDSPSQPGGNDPEYVDLGEWLRNTEPARSTRMQVDDPRPTGDEQADFDEMLRRFKRGVAANVEAEDYDAHYDLGVAYKEMGLVDEAIAQFQRALKGPAQRVRSYEALGHCFVEKQQYPIAAALLQRATEIPGSDDQQLVGVLYLLGFAMEHMGRPAEALPYYLRVFAVDIEFRDIAERVAALGNSSK